jgi:hypothetical protein
MKKITLLFIISLIFNFSSAQIVAPWSENFNQINDGSGWSLMLNQEGGWAQWRVDGDLGGDGDIWHGWSLNPGIAPGDDAIPGYEDAYTLYHDDDQPPFGSVNDWIITPVLDCTELSSPAVSFVEYQTYDSSYYEFHAVYYSEDYDGTNKETATWVELQNGPAPIGTPTTVEHVIPSTTTAIAWQYQGNYADNWFIDDVFVGDISGICPAPQINSWTMTADGVVMDATNDSSIQSYVLEWNATSFVPGDGTASGSATFDSFPYTLTGLEEGSYYFAMQSVCEDGQSDWIGPDNWTVGELCSEVYSLPYLNDFNSVPEFWTACQSFEDADADGNFWQYINYTADELGDYVAMSASWDGSPLTPDNWLVMGPVDLTSSNDAELTWKVRGIDSGYCEENYSVYISTYSNSGSILGDENAVVYNETISSLLGDGCGTTFGERSIDISNAAGNLVYIALRHHDVTDMYHLNIDDVAVTSSTMSIDEIELGIIHSYDKTSKLLKIQSSSDLITGVEIYDLNGRMIQSNFGNEPSMMISFESFENGIYIVNVSTEVGQKSIKLLRQ